MISVVSEGRARPFSRYFDGHLIQVQHTQKQWPLRGASGQRYFLFLTLGSLVNPNFLPRFSLVT